MKTLGEIINGLRSLEAKRAQVLTIDPETGEKVRLSATIPPRDVAEFLRVGKEPRVQNTPEVGDDMEICALGGTGE